MIGFLRKNFLLLVVSDVFLMFIKNKASVSYFIECYFYPTPPFPQPQPPSYPPLSHLAPFWVILPQARHLRHRLRPSLSTVSLFQIGGDQNAKPLIFFLKYRILPPKKSSICTPKICQIFTHNANWTKNWTLPLLALQSSRFFLGKSPKLWGGGGQES